MIITLAIEPHRDSEDLAFGEISIFHVECGNNKVSIHRNPATSIYSLRCKMCDFQIDLKNKVDGSNSIFQTSIDEQSRTLNPEEYNSATAVEVELVSNNKQA